ncbi:MAG: hypothetical protein KatS3mg059_0847 [Thermomicrobiales bacterium]|nr:MAG: hypothetical protein KatS3mg059_0847 [Thermomicrobiales bacterium]
MVADYNPAIRVSVEYKPVEPRRVSLVASMADALLAVRDVGRPNFGVQIDFCHSLMARERPAAAAARALAEGRLYGVHLNDGYGPADDGLPAASVHLWETLELLWYLRVFDYRGTIYFDTFPERVDPRSEAAHNIMLVQQLDRLLDRLSPDELRSLQRERDSLGVTRLIRSLVLEMGRMTTPPAVTVAGSLHMDVIAAAERLPLPGESLIGSRFTMHPGGKAGNQATQLALHGIRTYLVSRVGQDFLGDELRSRLSDRGVCLDYTVVDPGRSTGASPVFCRRGRPVHVDYRPWRCQRLGRG